MITDWVKAFVVLFGGIIVVMVMLPVYNSFFPIIKDSFGALGATIILLLSGAVLLIVAGLIYNFVMDSNPEASQNY